MALNHSPAASTEKIPVTGPLVSAWGVLATVLDVCISSPIVSLSVVTLFLQQSHRCGVGGGRDT